MGLEYVSGTDLSYYLIAYDKHGAERLEAGELVSDQVAKALEVTDPKNGAYTDVFILCHGWKGDVPAACEQFEKWIRAMAACGEDARQMRVLCSDFRALVVGLHWPSLPWGNETLGRRTGDVVDESAVGEFVSEYADRTSESTKAKEALAVIARYGQVLSGATLPTDLASAYGQLAGETGVSGDGPGGAPGSDQESFDPERIYQAARRDGSNEIRFERLLSPLRQLSFWRMKDRALRIGASSGVTLVNKLQRANRELRIHLMGHSFGCIVVASALRGSETNTLVRPVASVALIQGALSLWSFCSAIPKVSSKPPGYFFPVVSDGRVSGPVIVTKSRHDKAVGDIYPLGAGLRRDVEYAPGQLPKYGGLGAFGAQGPGLTIVEGDMLPVGKTYSFELGTFYNLESSEYICGGTGLSGAHSEIMAPEVAHAVWGAALSAQSVNHIDRG